MGAVFTTDDAVDLINAFCIPTGDEAVLDPACGSGSFLVRAYYRKRRLRPEKAHVELLGELFGCDIAAYPAHLATLKLATLNLAGREINDEANYPRIRRDDFFAVDPGKPFCTLPPDRTEVALPPLQAIVGNPPYARQEKIEGEEEDCAGCGVAVAGSAAAGPERYPLLLPGAAALLEEGGYFGFLTSSSWLDVEYGVALQKWILQNFKLVAVRERSGAVV